MKKIIFLIMTTLAIATSCSGQAKKDKNGANAGTTIQMTKADFLKKVADFENSPSEWKYLGDKPAIIDFYADWCGPCKQVAPILEELAKEYKDEIYIYKVNVDTEQELAAIFRVQSIPSMLFAPLSDVPQMATGAMPKEELKKAIDSVLLGKKEATSAE